MGALGSKLRSIVFDVDGTLYRQSGLRRAMLFRLLRHALGSPFDSMAMFRALRAYRRAQERLRDAAIEGDLAAAQIRLACEEAGLAEDVVAPIVARWMETEPLPLLPRFVDPALPALLDEARARGLRLGILSDYPAHAKIEALGLGGRFEVLVAAQDRDVNRFKPHPHGLLAALKRLDVAAADALYVGDRPDVDAPVARAAGVSCVIIGPHAHHAKGNGSSEWTGVADYRELHALLFSSTSESST